MPDSQGPNSPQQQPNNPKIRFNDPPRTLGGGGGSGGGGGAGSLRPRPNEPISFAGGGDDEEIVVGADHHPQQHEPHHPQQPRASADHRDDADEPHPVPVDPSMLRQHLAASHQQSHAPMATPSGGGDHGSSIIGSSKIRAIEKPLAGSGEESWTRAPTKTGRGATHVRTFHSKLNDDSLRYLDAQINEWLDHHPEYEVKFVSTSIGEFTGKIKEPHMIAMVWV